MKYRFLLLHPIILFPLPVQANLCEPAVVTANNVHFRSGPSMNSQVQFDLMRGARIVTYGQQGEWVQSLTIHPPGSLGWISERYLDTWVPDHSYLFDTSILRGCAHPAATGRDADFAFYGLPETAGVQESCYLRTPEDACAYSDRYAFSEDQSYSQIPLDIVVYSSVALAEDQQMLCVNYGVENTSDSDIDMFLWSLLWARFDLSRDDLTLYSCQPVLRSFRRHAHYLEFVPLEDTRLEADINWEIIAKAYRPIPLRSESTSSFEQHDVDQEQPRVAATIREAGFEIANILAVTKMEATQSFGRVGIPGGLLKAH